MWKVKFVWNWNTLFIAFNGWLRVCGTAWSFESSEKHSRQFIWHGVCYQVCSVHCSVHCVVYAALQTLCYSLPLQSDGNNHSHLYLHSVIINYLLISWTVCHDLCYCNCDVLSVVLICVCLSVCLSVCTVSVCSSSIKEIYLKNLSLYLYESVCKYLCVCRHISPCVCLCIAVLWKRCRPVSGISQVYRN